MFNLQYPSGSPCSIRCMAIFGSTTTPKVYFFPARQAKTLEGLLTSLDAEHDGCNKVMAKGECAGFPAEFPSFNSHQLTLMSDEI